MNLYNVRKVDFVHNDDRGCLIQLVHEGFSQVNLLISNKGSNRGAHFHKKTKEAFYVIDGAVLTTLWNDKFKQTVVFKKGDFFEIPVNILHNMYFQEDCSMIQLYELPVVDLNGNKDIFLEEDYYAHN